MFPQFIDLSLPATSPAASSAVPSPITPSRNLALSRSASSAFYTHPPGRVETPPVSSGTWRFPSAQLPSSSSLPRRMANLRGSLSSSAHRPLYQGDEGSSEHSHLVRERLPTPSPSSFSSTTGRRSLEGHSRWQPGRRNGRILVPPSSAVPQRHQTWGLDVSGGLESGGSRTAITASPAFPGDSVEDQETGRRPQEKKVSACKSRDVQKLDCCWGDCFMQWRSNELDEDDKTAWREFAIVELLQAAEYKLRDLLVVSRLS